VAGRREDRPARTGGRIRHPARSGMGSPRERWRQPHHVRAPRPRAVRGCRSRISDARLAGDAVDGAASSGTSVGPNRGPLAAASGAQGDQGDEPDSPNRGPWLGRHATKYRMDRAVVQRERGCHFTDGPRQSRVSKFKSSRQHNFRHLQLRGASRSPAEPSRKSRRPRS
jgi:hypothetical protein